MILSRYVKFLEPFHHYQIPKWNGTKGQVTLDDDNVGVLNIHRGLYEFEDRGIIKPTNDR